MARPKLANGIFYGTQQEFAEIIDEEFLAGAHLLFVKDQVEDFAKSVNAGERIQTKIRGNNREFDTHLRQILYYAEKTQKYGLTPEIMGEGIELYEGNNNDHRERLISIAQDLYSSSSNLKGDASDYAIGLIQQLQRPTTPLKFKVSPPSIGLGNA